jgi:S-DNA-T family DNA segregation ATPase FtsK/SpoIIIE
MNDPEQTAANVHEQPQTHAGEPGGKDCMSTDMNAEPDQAEEQADGGRVIDLASRRTHTDTRQAAEDGQQVFEGELVSPEESAALDRRRAATAVRQLQRAHPVRVVRVLRDAETRSGKVSRATLRTGWTVVQGVASWARRAWDASTLGVYRRQIKAAEAAGNHELLTEWTDRKEHAQERRHRRLMDLPDLALGIAKGVGVGVLGVLLLVLFIGLFTQLTGVGEFTDVLTGVLEVIRWVFTAVAFAWTPLLMAAPFLLLLAAYREGTRRATPGWLATAAESDMDITIDESTIAAALAALRIPQVADYLKQGLPLQYLTTARRDGRGTHAVLRLPAGVTAEKIARRRADLATGLHRLAKEVWPTTGAEAGVLDLWVADKGALAEGAGPYPLLDAKPVDVFKGVPFGKTLRGDPLTAPVMECNTLCGGMPGQGKSSAARVIMLGAALDPTAELRIWVPDSNFDFEAFAPRCSRYVMGAADEQIAQILADLRELHAEVQRRGELLISNEEPSVTRQLASRTGSGLHPLFCLLEEAHVAIQHKTYGKEISQLLIDIVKLGRKRGIHLIVSTQAPTKDSMPRDVTRNCSNGVAFAVGDHVANDALLGQGAYSGGHRATELIPGTDKGTAVCKGLSGERSDIVQVYFVSVTKEHDQVRPIIDKALAMVAERGDLPGQQRETPQITESRDLLEDLDAILGGDPVPAADLPALLARHAPHWPPYQSLTGKRLRELLAEQGVKVPSTGNRFPVDPDTVRDALTRRSTADLDEQT